MQCRLCASCWSYWKKYGGLKMPTRLDGERPGPNRNNMVYTHTQGHTHTGTHTHREAHAHTDTHTHRPHPPASTHCPLG